MLKLKLIETAEQQVEDAVASTRLPLKQFAGQQKGNCGYERRLRLNAAVSAGIQLDTPDWANQSGEAWRSAIDCYICNNSDSEFAM